MKLLHALLLVPLLITALSSTYAQDASEIGRMKGGYADASNHDTVPFATASRCVTDRTGRVVISWKTGQAVHTSSTSGSAYTHTEVWTPPTANRTVTWGDASGRVNLEATLALTPGTTVTATPGSATVLTLTPAQAETINLTTTGMASGHRFTLVVTTSGTSSFTLTFGTGFKTTGTLATGTVTAKVFTISFAYDGTNANELSRTTAM
jgi:hypothetical protein